MRMLTIYDHPTHSEGINIGLSWFNLLWFSAVMSDKLIDWVHIEEQYAIARSLVSLFIDKLNRHCPNGD